MQFPDEEILQFLIKAYPEHTFKSRVFKARDELSRYKYSKYYTGDRIVYVQAPFLRPFPYKGFVDNFECRFWHPSQHADARDVSQPIMLRRMLYAALPMRMTLTLELSVIQQILFATTFSVI